MTTISAIGSILVTFGSFINSSLILSKLIPISGLMIIAAASGALKTVQCVFGGNQFNLPEDEKLLSSYFSIHYLVGKIGIFIGQIAYPIISKHEILTVSLGLKDCYPIVFIISICLMISGLIVFITGTSLYSDHDKSDNVIIRSCACIIHATREKIINKDKSQSHWLNYAEKCYGSELVSNIKKVINLSKFLLTYPLFWALQSQTNSRWVFQADQMNGNIEFYNIKADQMVMLKTLFSILSVPIAEHILFPILEKIGIIKIHHKIALGMCFASSSFIVAAIIEYFINRDYITIICLLPQYFLVGLAEVFVWVPTLSLIYTEAPRNMKSLITSILFLTDAAGNLVVIVISLSSLFHHQYVEFLVYSFLMFLNMILFLTIMRKKK